MVKKLIIIPKKRKSEKMVRHASKEVIRFYNL
jgi:hypothetical protein